MTHNVLQHQGRKRIPFRDDYNNRKDMGALHNCQIQLRGKKASSPAYPAELNTLGDHLRKARLDRGLSQPDVAKVLNVTPDSVTGWELNRNQPTANFAKAVIDFIGYIPFMDDNLSLGKRLLHARLISGKTQRQVAAEIGCDASNLRYIERDLRVPQKKLKEKLEDFIQDCLSRFLT
ncbi:MAG: helix-turn-helix transcriptional regulator [Saprospiraceae bacterium]|nr:helix-turn-helix transcriptional regulator [Saprospiraceae bacterium]